MLRLQNTLKAPVKRKLETFMLAFPGPLGAQDWFLVLRPARPSSCSRAVPGNLVGQLSLHCTALSRPVPTVQG